jgi:cytoskeletal protein CcmA (bactofilin family)
MSRKADRRNPEKGSAFFIVLLLSIASIVLIGAFLSTALGRVRDVELQVAESSAWNAAESGMNAIVEQVWATYTAASPGLRTLALEPLDGKVDPAKQLKLTGRRMGRSTFDALVREVRVVGSNYADVEFTCVATNEKASKALVAVVRYGRRPSRVFDHAYFINNFGWLWGSGITAQGDVRSNGNFSVKSATVNGDIFASENSDIGAVGTVTGTSYHQNTTDYNSTAPARTRPTTPSAPSEDLNGNGTLDAGEDANGNGSLDTYEYSGGYDGDSERHEKQAVIEMPYLGDLQIYRDLAIAKKGTISQSGTTLVDAVLGDDAAEKKSLLIVGTAADPIVLNGPVVIESDVVLKGYITGRGTIYAGRNVHIIGNLQYADSPQWNKPIYDQEGTRTANKSKDLVGLAAKGSIVMGDYTGSTWKSNTNYYQRPPFTNPYVVDPTDKVNGYESYKDSNGNSVFDGNYTALDGGKKDDGAGGLTGRRFYESSFSDDEIRAKADGSYVSQIDAILYTNHLLTGRVGPCTWNGTLVSRDEAIIYSGSIRMNYDVRVRGDGYEYLDIFLPREPAYRILYWGEGLTEEVLPVPTTP